MACLQTLNGIGYSCEPQLAGIKEVYIANDEDVTDASIDIEDMVVDSITMASGKKFVGYKFAKNTGSLTSTLTKNDENGTRYYTNEIALVFNKLEALKHIEIEALAAGYLKVIVLDNNGKYWYVGHDNYVSATAATAETGTSFDDRNGYTTTMSAMSAYLPFEVPSSVVTSIIEEPA